MLLTGLITLLVAGLLFMILWKIVNWSALVSGIVAVVVAVALGAMIYFWVLPKIGLTAAPNTSNAPPTVAQPTDQGPKQPANTNEPTVATEPPAMNTGNFGNGTCTINSTIYTLAADPSAVWMDEATLRVLAQYGGHCEVTTFKQGWYWSVGNGTITLNGATMERGNTLVANEGKWVFNYDAPAPGTTNESLGLTFRDNLPQVETSDDAFGTGLCTIEGQSYSVAYDATAVWEDDETLRQLWLHGGSCTVTTFRNGWYWSTTGAITLDGEPMANGQRLVAPAGTYTFTYEGATDANGFTIRDNVPFGQ